MAVRKILRRHKRWKEYTSVNTFHLRHIIFKMRVPILVLTLVVIYGTCRTYAKESTDLIKEELNDGNQLSIPYASLEKSLSRNKRSILLLAPLTRIALRLATLSTNIVIRTAFDFVKFIFNVLSGQNVCPKIDGLSFGLIDKIIRNPFGAIKTVICYFLQVIGSGSRALSVKFLHLFSQFIRRAFLPGMHTMLNVLADTGLLPPSLRALVISFNVLYRILQLIGYVNWICDD